MNIQARREVLIEWLMGLNDPSIFSIVEEIAKSEQSGDWWEDLPKEVKDGIHEGHEDVVAGRVTPHNEAMGIVRRRLGIDS